MLGIPNHIPCATEDGRTLTCNQPCRICKWNNTTLLPVMHCKHNTDSLYHNYSISIFMTKNALHPKQKTILILKYIDFTPFTNCYGKKPTHLWLYYMDHKTTLVKSRLLKHSNTHADWHQLYRPLGIVNNGKELSFHLLSLHICT